MVLELKDLFTIVTALIAVVISIVSERRQRRQSEDNKKTDEKGIQLSEDGNRIRKEDIAMDVHRQFAEMWFMMDGIFIEYPELHQYFYPSGDIDYRKKLPQDPRDMERAICIAEKFRDVFQYSEHMAKSIIDLYEGDCASYLMYMQRIQNTEIYKEMNRRNHINIEDRKQIGGELAEELVRRDVITVDGDGTYSWNQNYADRIRQQNTLEESRNVK